MKWALWGAVLWGGCAFGAVGQIEILDRSGRAVESYEVEKIRCKLVGNNLELTLETENGVLELVGAEFRSLSHNSRFSWNVVEGSASSLVFVDRLGFEWKPVATKPAGQCLVGVAASSGRHTFNVNCKNLKNEEMPGLLSLRVPRIAPDCGRD